MKPSDSQAFSLDIFGSQTKYWVYHPTQPQTIFMLHGFRGNHQGLKYIIAGLSGYRIVVPDLPGFGESLPMTDRPHDIDGYSDFARQFMKLTGLTHPVLLGHSFGTIVAAHLAAREPELFSKLILINPIIVSPRTGAKGAITKLVEAYYWLGTNTSDDFSQWVLGSRLFNRSMSLSLSRTSDPALRRLVYQHHLGDLDQAQHPRAIAESFAASITKTALDDAARIHLETLLIAGEQDPIASADSQRQLQAAISRSRLILIPKVGHLVHLETPAAASDAISDFLG